MTETLPFSQACENNKTAILQILKSAFAPVKRVLEIGSGTGQHAVYFAKNLPHLQWQPTDRKEALPVLKLRLQAEPQPNLLPALTLNVLNDRAWPNACDAIFSANTAHIMPWDLVRCMIERSASILPPDGVFALYGPFNYGGQFTSEGNAEFDRWLKQQASYQGIRDFEQVDNVASSRGLTLVRDHAMPANNRLLIWRKG